MHAAGNYKTYQVHRVVAVDDSKVLLPDNQDVIDKFGTILDESLYPTADFKELYWLRWCCKLL
jgi:hypothetical protein